MKFRLRVFEVAFVFLGLLFVSSHASTGQAHLCLNVKLPVILWEPDESAWSQPSKAQVLTIIDRMQKIIDKIQSKGPFDKATIGDIVLAYGANGIMSGAEGWTLRGNRQIATYFSNLLRNSKVSDFKIEIKFVYAKEFTERFNDTKTPADAVVHSVYFVFSNSYSLDGRPVYSGGSTNCPHIKGCDCSNGK
jgi:hypothetical protein